MIEIVPEIPALHAEAIETLYDTTFGPGHFAKTAERLREYNQSLPELNRVAFVESKVVAATRIWPVQVEMGGSAVFVGPVAVDPVYRGQRLGLTVTQEALNASTAAGWSGAILIGAPNYFREIGFRVVPAGRLLFPGPQDPNRIMVADLAGNAGTYSGKISVS